MVDKITPAARYLYDKKIGETASEPSVVQKWLLATQKIIERTSAEREGDEKLKGYLSKVKNAFHRKYIPSQENFPRDEFLKFKSRVDEELGRGKRTQVSEQEIKLEIQTQQESLDEWIEYFTSPDSSSFPTWAKYWAFNGIVRMSGIQKVEPETMMLSFTKREENTFGRFPELNREALAMAVEFIVKKVEQGIILDDALKQESFRYVYSYFINKLREATLLPELEITEGTWVRYDQGEDAEALDTLVNSLAEKNTGWCTATRSVAQDQLRRGDFYIYYSRSASERPNPRIAIRMEGAEIAEIRGIGPNQNFDPVISGTSILEDKLQEFGSEGEKYKKRVADMKRLTGIKRRHDKGEELTKEDLRFLYEIDGKIEGFGYQKDPRIEEIINYRKVKADLANIFDCKEEEISSNDENFSKEGIKVHLGDIAIWRTVKRETLLPEIVMGELYLPFLSLTDRIVLPKFVSKSLTIGSSNSLENLILPEKVGDMVILDVSSKDYQKIKSRYPKLKIININLDDTKPTNISL